MEADPQKLLKDIQNLSEELQQLIADKNISHPEILKKSRELDQLIEEYKRIKNK